MNNKMFPLRTLHWFLKLCARYEAQTKYMLLIWQACKGPRTVLGPARQRNSLLEKAVSRDHTGQTNMSKAGGKLGSLGAEKGQVIPRPEKVGAGEDDAKEGSRRRVTHRRPGM